MSSCFQSDAFSTGLSHVCRSGPTVSTPSLQGNPCCDDTSGGGPGRAKGYQPQEIIGQHFWRFYTQEDRADELPERHWKSQPIWSSLTRKCGLITSMTSTCLMEQLSLTSCVQKCLASLFWPRSTSDCGTTHAACTHIRWTSEVRPLVE